MMNKTKKGLLYTFLVAVMVVGFNIKHHEFDHAKYAYLQVNNLTGSMYLITPQSGEDAYLNGFLWDVTAWERQLTVKMN